MPALILLISIHALHEESDTAHMMPSIVFSGFQSTLSMRRATLADKIITTKTQVISIHALHEESDCSSAL